MCTTLVNTGHRHLQSYRRTVLFFTIIVLFGLSEVQAECPSPNIRHVLKDPVVSQALDDAWKDSNEGKHDEHEEGGWIKQCRKQNESFCYDYSTEVERWRGGGVNGINPTPLPNSTDCRVVAFFHTHPGPSTRSPNHKNNGGKNDHYANEKPSGKDKRFSKKHGLPGIITYGEGASYQGTTDITFGWRIILGGSKPKKLNWACPKENNSTCPEKIPCNSCGDVHIRTPDGLSYDFQGAGEYLFLESNDKSIVIQSRLEPYKKSKYVSINTAFAANVSGDIINFYVSSSSDIIINNDKMQLTQNELIDLPRGGTISYKKSRLASEIIVEWPNGFIASAVIFGGSYMDIGVKRPKEFSDLTYRGLIGNLNSNPVDDLMTISGEQLTPPLDYEMLYSKFGNGWKIKENNSLFNYKEGENTDTFSVENFPERILTTADLDKNKSAKAEKICKENNITKEPFLSDCIFDITLTGEDIFYLSSIASPRPLKKLIISDKVCSEAPLNSNRYDDGHGGEVQFPQGKVSFADIIVSFSKGNPSASDRDSNPDSILGVPDFRSNDRGYLTLGCGGAVTLEFTDNALIDTEGSDLYVFEIGPSVEPTQLEISEDGDNWINIGKISGGRSDIDISNHTDEATYFRFVRLTDLKSDCGGGTPGADIDAVGAIGSCQWATKN